MPISLSLDLLPKEALADAKKGVLGDDVMVQFLCNTGPGGQHDPDAKPDSHVRPSHAALHGKIFKLSEAPVPPLDYGCRCAVSYVAVKDTPAAQVLDRTTEAKPTTVAKASTEWLDANVDGWEKIGKAVDKESDKDSVAAGVAVAKKLDIPMPRMIVEMVLDVVRLARRRR